MEQRNRLQILADKFRFHYCLSSVEETNVAIEDIVTQKSSQPSEIIALSPIIEKILVMMENEDNIGLADILEYELCHFDKRTENS
tara:strand:+ start:885 stop:1139 length:255 start_codon:yes stop_codon:yes gene_type:complete